MGLELSSSEQAHAVVLYRGEKELRALHFCWMHVWCDQPFNRPSVWVELPLDPSEARSLAALCKRVAEVRALDKMPFAFRHDPRSRFELPTQRFALGPDAHGFTCATFILVLLASINYHPIDFGTWRSRPCDAPWQRKIIQVLKRTYEESELKAQLEEVGALRFRPEEVVGACSDEPPTAFLDALPRGRQLLGALNATTLFCNFDL